MKNFSLGVILICALCSNHAAAQRGAPPGSGGGSRPPAGGHGGQPGSSHRRSDAGLFPMNRFHGERGGFGSAGYLPWSYPGIYGDFGSWGSSNGIGDQPTPLITMAPQPQAPPEPPPPPPREPAQPVTREYNWPGSADNSADVFSLVSKAGTVHLAIAVWVQDGVVHYTPRDAVPEKIALDAIDRQATRLLNAKNGLHLSLPQP